MDTETKVVNFRLRKDEYEGLKILAALSGETQATVVRALIMNALKEYKDNVEAYKKLLAANRRPPLQKELETLRKK